MDKPVNEIQKPGITNPKIIDRIHEIPANNEVVLSMLENRPWKSSPQQLLEIENKFNHYLGYVLDGFFTKQYPQYTHRQVRIQLECLETPGDEESGFVKAMASYCESQNLEFGLEIKTSGEFEKYFEKTNQAFSRK